MKYTAIANTGVEVSPIGFGTVKIGRDLGVKYPDTFTIPDDQQVLKLLDICRELGINTLDPPPAYGNSEQRLGQLLKSAQRQQWIISSKAGEEFDPLSGASNYDFSERAITASVERSLRRLDTDYLDIVMIHSNGDDLQIIEQHLALQTLAKLKQQGKIRAIGMSTKTIDGGIAALQQADCAMVTYNLMHRQELAVIEYAQRHNKGIFIKKAFASGHLQQQQYDDPILSSLKLIFAQPGVSSAVIGTINQRNLRENVQKYQRAISEISL
ncbi:MAG: oxidoreductase, aldo/keto reductase family protein [Osedax symbiont Rs2]|nr:MAG: oxidoreductase, aldo/keto reductase family protein [Osedax symbiont Rs2]